VKSRSGGAQSPSDMARPRTGNEDIHQPLGALLRSRLTIFPVSGRRTPKRAKTRVYSSRISSLTSQTNVSPSLQSPSSLALGFLGGISKDLSPAHPPHRARKAELGPARSCRCGRQCR
jgi:hypothetical protein